MGRLVHLALVVALIAARIAGAQPTPEAAGSDSEPTFEPTKITAASTDTKTPDQPLVLDEMRIGTNDRLELFLFGDASAAIRSDERPGFAVGAIGIQITAHLAQGLVGRMETALEYNDEHETSVDMERAYLEYRTGGWMISGGRTHAELGYWNNAFHHGRWLQLTIERPHVLRFEDDGGMLPIHQVGVTVAHAPPHGEAGLDVALGVANGHGRTLLGIQNLGDDNYAKSVLLRVGAVGLADNTLRVGANVGIDKIKGQPAPTYQGLDNQSMLELITGAYVALRSDTVIVFSEIYDVLHRGGDKSWNTVDGFVVAGYRLGDLTPYAQLEARQGDGSTDPFYNPGPGIEPEAVQPLDFREAMLGSKYDLSTWSALKLELAIRRTEVTDPTMPAVKTEYRAEVNWSFGR
jgi:hypothetical protein